MGNPPNTRCARCGEVVLTLSTAADLVRCVGCDEYIAPDGRRLSAREGRKALALAKLGELPATVEAMDRALRPEPSESAVERAALLAEVCRAHRERVGIPEGPLMPGVELERVEAHGGYRDAATPARVEVRFVTDAKSNPRALTVRRRVGWVLVGAGVVVLFAGGMRSGSLCGVAALLLAVAVLLLPSKRARPIAALTRVDGRGDILVAHVRGGERAVPAHQVGLGTREVTVQGDRPSWALWLRVGAETYRLTGKHGVEEDVLRTQLILEDALGLETSQRLAPALAERLGS